MFQNQQPGRSTNHFSAKHVVNKLSVPLRSCPVANSMDTLKHGDSGLSVEQLQTALNLADLTRLPRLTVDGQFNGFTVGRVMEFQSLNGLTVDGVVGPKTNGRLPQPATVWSPHRQKHPRRPLRTGSQCV